MVDRWLPFPAVLLLFSNKRIRNIVSVLLSLNEISNSHCILNHVSSACMNIFTDVISGANMSSSMSLDVGCPMISKGHLMVHKQCLPLSPTASAGGQETLCAWAHDPRVSLSSKICWRNLSTCRECHKRGNDFILMVWVNNIIVKCNIPPLTPLASGTTHFTASHHSPANKLHKSEFTANIHSSHHKLTYLVLLQVAHHFSHLAHTTSYSTTKSYLRYVRCIALIARVNSILQYTTSVSVCRRQWIMESSHSANTKANVKLLET